MFFEINKSLCSMYNGLDPLKLLDYPAEDVFDLIRQTIIYNKRMEKKKPEKKNKEVIRRPAGDDWF